MAVLQKIRNRGPLLVTILGIALLLFILQIAFEAWGPAQNAKNQNAGEVCGEEITIQDYQTLVEDWKLFYELLNPNINFSESDHDQIRDIAWNQYVNSVIVEKECKKLVLTVTDKEVQEIIETGASSFLNVPVFINSETGKYDYSILQNFLQIYSDAKKQGQQLPDEYEKIYNYYKFAKANIRQEFLNNKYIGLLQGSLTSNPIETKQNFDERVNENDILLASIPFTAIDDKDITVEDKDVSAKYEEMKETFALDVETRDIKLIDVKIVPSEQDEKNLKSEMDSIYKSFVNSSTNIEVDELTNDL
jgi:peptidyl-prolyl cis-trans isomerase D